MISPNPGVLSESSSAVRLMGIQIVLWPGARPVGKFKVARHHAYNGVGFAVQIDGVAEHVRIALVSVHHKA